MRNDEDGPETGPWKGPERRAYPRYMCSYSLMVGVFGYSPSPAEAIDLSRGGLKARLSRGAYKRAVGKDCLIRFLDAGEELNPHSACATVKRVEGSERTSVLAFEFDTPLEELELARDVAR